MLHGKRRWLLMLLAGLIFPSWASDSRLIAPDTQIGPVLILASYRVGQCSQNISGNFIQRASARKWGDTDNAKQQPTYVFCRYLPEAMRLALVSRGIDTSLQEFVTEPLENEEYVPKAKAFRDSVLDAPENAGRYVLEYQGTTFDMNMHAYSVLFLLGPLDASTGKRTPLGRFELDAGVLFEMLNGSAPGIAARYRLRSPMEVAGVVANSFQARCQKDGLFDKRCADRLHLASPLK